MPSIAITDMALMVHFIAKYMREEEYAEGRVLAS
jgi:hypothetical protein